MGTNSLDKLRCYGVAQSWYKVWNKSRKKWESHFFFLLSFFFFLLFSPINNCKMFFEFYASSRASPRFTSSCELWLVVYFQIMDDRFDVIVINRFESLPSSTVELQRISGSMPSGRVILAGWGYHFFSHVVTWRLVVEREWWEWYSIRWSFNEWGWCIRDLVSKNWLILKHDARMRRAT